MTDTFTHGYALLIGVGRTAYAPWSLPVAGRDVQALRRLLTDPARCGYPDDAAHLQVLTAAAATGAGILAGLAWLRARVTADPQATALVYYSGHGWVDAAGIYYLIPHEGDPLHWPGSFLPATDFTAALRAVRPQRLLVFLDCCHAAGMADKAPGAALPAGGQSAAFPPGLTDALAQGRGRAICASSRAEEPAQYRPDGRLSLYTEQLLAALQGAGNRPGDTRVTVGNLMAHLGRAVPESARQLRQAVQTPYFKFETEDFPVALLHGGKGLPAGGWAAVQAEAQATIARLVAGAGAVVAQEIRAPVATGGSLAAGGNVTLSVPSPPRGGGIRAGRIRAENVVQGVQAPAGTPIAPALVAAAQGGSIEAEDLEAENVVSGVQQTPTGAPSGSPGALPPPAEFRRRLERLSDTEIETLCQDHFWEVFNAFGRGQGRGEKINLLLEQCRRKPELAARLAAVLPE